MDLKAFEMFGTNSDNPDTFETNPGLAICTVCRLENCGNQQNQKRPKT